MSEPRNKLVFSQVTELKESSYDTPEFLISQIYNDFSTYAELGLASATSFKGFQWSFSMPDKKSRKKALAYFTKVKDHIDTFHAALLTECDRLDSLPEDDEE